MELGNLTKVLHRSKLLAMKHSPQILIAVGVAGVVASTVMACKATLKVEEIVKDSEEMIKTIKETREKKDEDCYSDNDYKKDLAIVYTKRAVALGKLYLPAAAVGLSALGCIAGSHVILSKRNAALAAAYKLMDIGYSRYRTRVIEEFGVEKDRMYRHGIEQEIVTVEEENANGKKTKIEKTVNKFNPEFKSDYARFFDQLSPYWKKDPELNLFFLKTQERYANDKLRTQGHLFLNEVYDMLGIPRSQAGALVGWVYDSGKDSFVDFDLYNPLNEGSRNFVNGYERSILLDFNVDGLIYDLI